MMKKDHNRVLFGLASVALTASMALAQHGSHAYRVHIGDGKWVTPAEASAKGYMLYRERWLPSSLKKKVKVWQRADKGVETFADAYHVKTKHYRIKTNTPHHITELEIRPFLDELYRTYVEVFREDFGLKGKAANKNHIFVYYGYQSWRSEQNKTRGNPGFYQVRGPLVVLYDPADVDGFYKTCFHEGAHQFFTAMLPGASLPLWLTEALACYFEGFTYSPSTGRITKHLVPRHRLRSAQSALREAQKKGASLAPHDMFMQFKQGVFDATHYGLAWSYLYFLVHREDGKHKKDVFRFIKAMNGSGAKSIYKVFKKATGKDLHEVEKGWVPFILGINDTVVTRHLILTSSNGSEDVQPNDRLVMINGCDIDNPEAFDKHWRGRDRKKPHKLLLRRKVDDRGGMDFGLRWVTVDVAVGSKLELDHSSSMPYMKTVVQ